jgi:hypothetical protein
MKIPAMSKWHEPDCDNGAGEAKSCGVCGECEEKVYRFRCDDCKRHSPCFLEFKQKDKIIIPYSCPYGKSIANWAVVKDARE